jgi:hypothetical protein
MTAVSFIGGRQLSPQRNTLTCRKSLIKLTTWCAYIVLSWVPIKLEKVFNREDKNMKLQGLSVTDWISDNWVWKCRATAYLSRNIFSRTKLCIYKCCCRYNRSTVFLFSKHPLKMIFMNCLLQNGHRSPCIPVHRKLMVVYRNLMSAYHKLWWLTRMFKGCIRMSDVIPLYILIYFANYNWIVFPDTCKFLLTNINLNMIAKQRIYTTELPYPHN